MGVESENVVGCVGVHTAAAGVQAVVRDSMHPTTHAYGNLP